MEKAEPINSSALAPTDEEEKSYQNKTGKLCEATER
jgi:hypothetical protein